MFSKDKFDKHFEPISEAADECTVTKEELNGEQKIMREIVDKVKKPTTYNGWEIIKMISEGQIAEGAEIEDVRYKYVYKYEDGDLYDNKYDDYIDTCLLINGRFKIIKPKRLVTYFEALDEKVNIRHKDWNKELSYTTPQNAISHLAKHENVEIKEMLTEKCWECEDND